MKFVIDQATLRAALIGLETLRQQNEQRIEELLRQLHGGKVGKKQPTALKRMVSAAGRERMAAAQQKRWAKYRAALDKKNATLAFPKRSTKIDKFVEVAAAVGEAVAQ